MIKNTNSSNILTVVALCTFIVLTFLIGYLIYGYKDTSEDVNYSRNYTVRVSNWIGSEYYECDTVIWISDTHFQLKNNDKHSPYLDMILSGDMRVVVKPNIKQIYEKKNI